MLTEISHRQCPRQLQHATFSPHHTGYEHIPIASMSNFSPVEHYDPIQNASFRQRLERPRQYARPLRSTISSPSQLVPSASSTTNSAEPAEHMLRRKTPNGTLAAGYDGSPVEWTRRPHASKHLLLPVSCALSNTKHLPRADSVEHPVLKTVQSFNAYAEGSHACQQQDKITSSGGSFQCEYSTNNLIPDLGWNLNGVPAVGLDSMLNQTSLPNHHYRLAGSQQIPTVLQPMWPPCLGPTSVHSPGPFGPYWPNGTYEPYRPAPLRDPRFQYSITEAGTSSTVSSQTQPAVLHYQNWLKEHDDLQHCDSKNRSVTNHPLGILEQYGRAHYNEQDSLNNNTSATLQQHRNSLAYRTKPPSWNENQQSQKLNEACSNLKLTTSDCSSGQYLHRGHGTEGGNAQFKEKVLVWAHRIYGSLLVAIEQTRRNSPSEQHLGHKQSGYYPQPPRRPYPSWSNKQSRDNSAHVSSLKPLPKSLKVVSNPQGYMENNRQATSSRARSFSNRQLLSHPVPASSASDLAKEPSNAHPRFHLHAAQPSYVPPQIAQDQHPTTPSAAALYAMDMLGKLCQESRWEWTDGMLLTGCLAYGLGDYIKAMKWYFKVLQCDANNVEAMSNLAATFISLDRRQEAEQYWLRSIKLRPSYFEAVEHLVGLLHEDHRGKEAVKVIDHVEQALRSHDQMLSEEQKSHLPGSTGRTRAGQLEFSGYAIPPSDNGRMLALIHGKGNVLYQMGDNVGAAKAFEEAILIGAGRRKLGIHGLIRQILNVFAEQSHSGGGHARGTYGSVEPILLPPEMALETSHLVFPPHGQLPGLEEVSSGMSQKAAISIVSNSLLSLAKIYQDGMCSSGASATAPRATSGVQEILALYYLSLSLQPSPSTANNVGILLAGVQQSARLKAKARSSNGQTPNVPATVPGVVPGSGIALALAYYDYGLTIDPRHAHLYTNLGSLFKDIGQLNAAIKMYERAVDCDGKFDIALANLANAVKDKGEIAEAIKYYKRAVTSNPEFAEAVCGLANALNSVCNWTGRGGIKLLRGDLDRWHVDEQGVLYDSKKSAVSSAGWIERVVSIVEKQLLDGRSWGNGILRSLGVENFLSQLGEAYSQHDNYARISIQLQASLEAWSDEGWEGAKVVRLIERATKRLVWQAYRDRFVDRRLSQASSRLRPQLPAALAIPSAPTVLPFHTFTCPLSAKQIRKISQRNGLRVSCSTLRAPWLPSHIYNPPRPPAPHLNIGYISSDFNNHPLAHLMQSVFGLHDRSRVEATCYATTASDSSVHRQQIEREAPNFHDASSWSIERLVNQVVADGIHILVNLNGYTRGAKNEVFAARPAPIQMSFMGFAGTLGAEWCDYLLADKIAIPPQTLRPWRRNVDLADQTQDGNNGDDQDDWVYGENIIFTKDTFFCCDHRQSAPDSREAQLSWPDEQQRRWKMRKELFPDIADDAVILGNFNQLYKIEPTTFRAWLRILSRVPKAILWLLRFPDLGERNLKHTAMLWVGAEVASRIIFTDVAPKHQHISRARVCDLFLDTPECNAHTTAADVLWSGTPLLTLPRYEYKMCSRMAASILRGALPKTPEGDRAAEDLIATCDESYEEQGVELASDLVYPTAKGIQGMGRGRLVELRKILYESRWTNALFDTRRWVRDLECAYGEAWRRWVAGESGDIWL